MTNEELKAIFEQARVLYGGSKRGLETEFANFVQHCIRPKDGMPKIKWQSVCKRILEAVKEQIEWRRDPKGEFRPEWKNFQTWTNNRCWEEDHAVKKKQAQSLLSNKCLICNNDGSYYRLNEQAQPVYVCHDCARCLRAAGVIDWGCMQKSAIEIARDRGKAVSTERFTAPEPPKEHTINDQKNRVLNAIDQFKKGFGK